MILYAILALFVLLVAVMALNTWVKKPAKMPAAIPPETGLDKDGLAQNLSGMIRLKTVTSSTMDGFDTDAFFKLHQYLEQTYPLIHKTLEKQTVNTYGLVYRWQGTGADKKPMLLMAHQDVVPVDARTENEWARGAFSGDIADGYIWGRGAIDMKGQLAAIFGAVEHLLEQGFAPRRDIYIALGFDEESMGTLGAQQMVRWFQERGIRFDCVIDEGGVVMDGKLIGANAMVAAIGISEKGYADIRLTAMSSGGHASRPPKQTAVGALGKAIVALETHQMKAALCPPVRYLLDAVGGYMKFPLNVIAANLWLTKPLLLAGLKASATSASMVRTTIAPTMLKGSTAPNVLAEQAEAVVNFRILPGNTVDGVLAHIKKTIANDDIKVEIIQAYNPSPVSPVDSAAYRAVQRTAADIFSSYVVTPYLMIAATDSRWYADITDGIYLFQPFRSLSEDLGTIHAVGERLSIDSLAEGTAFFIQLVKNMDE